LRGAGSERCPLHTWRPWLQVLDLSQHGVELEQLEGPDGASVQLGMATSEEGYEEYCQDLGALLAALPQQQLQGLSKLSTSRHLTDELWWDEEEMGARRRLLGGQAAGFIPCVPGCLLRRVAGDRLPACPPARLPARLPAWHACADPSTQCCAPALHPSTLPPTPQVAPTRGGWSCRVCSGCRAWRAWSCTACAAWRT
jgi:hypothetical protein